MKQKLVKRIAMVGASLVFLFIITTFFFNRGMDKINVLEIKSVDISNLADGDFQGKYCEGRWCYDITVTIKDHKICDIHTNNEKMKMFADLQKGLTKRIIDEQNVALNGISGATITSKAFLKAVENALNH